MTTKKTPPPLALVSPPAEETLSLPPPDPFSCPLKGVWLTGAQGFHQGSTSVLLGQRFQTQLGASGVVTALDLSPSTGAVRVTMSQGGPGAPQRTHTAYLGTAAVLLSEALR